MGTATSTPGYPVHIDIINGDIYYYYDYTLQGFPYINYNQDSQIITLDDEARYLTGNSGQNAYY